MDYRSAARFRATKLTDLIAEEMLASGDGFFKSSKRAMSAKFRAKITGVKQKFDPLNLASALVGRNRLATTLIGRLFGRSPEDITYFAGDRGEKARPIRRFRYKNPLISSITSSNNTANTEDERLANIFGKIYNIMYKKYEERKKSKEIEDNFKEEQKQEDNRRHEELIDAIIKMKGGKLEKMEKNNKGGGIFDALKNLFDKLMSFISPIASFFTFFLKPLEWLFDFFKGVGKLALTALKALFSGAGAFLAFMGDELIKLVRKMVPSLFSPESSTETTKKITQARDPKTGRFIKNKKESKILKGAKGILKFLQRVPGLSSIAAGASLIMDVENTIKENESGNISDNETKKRITIAVGGALGGVSGAEIGGILGSALGSVVPGVGTLLGGVGGAVGGFLLGQESGSALAEKAYDYFSNSDVENINPKMENDVKVPTNNVTPSSNETFSDSQIAIPDMTQQSPTQTQSFMDAIQFSDTPNKLSSIIDKTKENLNLQLEDVSNQISSSPVVMNNNSVQEIPKKINSGIASALATIRDKDLENTLFDNLRRVSYI